jgi:hypothetical protein
LIKDAAIAAALDARIDDLVVALGSAALANPQCRAAHVLICGAKLMLHAHDGGGDVTPQALQAIREIEPVSHVLNPSDHEPPGFLAAAIGVRPRIPAAG